MAWQEAWQDAWQDWLWRESRQQARTRWHMTTTTTTSSGSSNLHAAAPDEHVPTRPPQHSQACVGIRQLPVELALVGGVQLLEEDHMALLARFHDVPRGVFDDLVDEAVLGKRIRLGEAHVPLANL